MGDEIKSGFKKYQKCPLCGFTFHINQGACELSCPLRANCEIIKCPNCNYGFYPERENTREVKDEGDEQG